MDFDEIVLKRKLLSEYLEGSYDVVNYFVKLPLHFFRVFLKRRFERVPSDKLMVWEDLWKLRCSFIVVHNQQRHFWSLVWFSF